jgi:hypothetical protein
MNWSTATRFLASAVDGGVLSELHGPAPLLPGKQPPAPIGQEVRWTSERLGHYGEEKSRTPTGNRIPVPMSSSPDPTNYTEMDGTSSRYVGDTIRMQYLCCETWQTRWEISGWRKIQLARTVVNLIITLLFVYKLSDYVFWRITLLN